MRGTILTLVVYGNSALAHPGHGAPDPHLHAVPLLLWLAGLGLGAWIVHRRLRSKRSTPT